MFSSKHCASGLQTCQVSILSTAMITHLLEVCKTHWFLLPLPLAHPPNTKGIPLLICIMGNIH